jgi:glycosyltransferase involved in cell wall biosynthesis
MLPHPSRVGDATDGISQVVLAYARHLPAFGVELVAPEATDYDLRAVHAGMTGGDCEVCHCHGLYWSADYDAPDWEYRTNALVIEAVRHARQVTVPSAWVAEAFQRDMHLSPHVVPHGIDWRAWQHGEPNEGYVLWNKNRAGDVCDPSPVALLAARFPGLGFVSTQQPDGDVALPNLKVTGLVPHPEMKRLVQRAGVYLATTKETFGIGILEAMAAGIPVLGYARGGALDLVRHGVNGYLAAPDDAEGLAEGLDYCLEHRAVLGDNGREMAKSWTWEAACEKVARIYELALQAEPPTVAVVIPSYNYAEFVGRAVESAMHQTYAHLTDIVVVDDGSQDDSLTRRVVEELVKETRVEAGREVQEIETLLATHRSDLETLDNMGEGGDSNSPPALARRAKVALLAEAENRLRVAEFRLKRAVGTRYLRQENAGVAVARNAGIAACQTTYLCCLDADDTIEPQFLEICVAALEADASLGVAYTGLALRSGERILKSRWPAACDFDRHIQGHNQVPTCCVFRREAWKRAGGYRQRYAPEGCGSEDAEFWLRLGAQGWGLRQVTEKPLFVYAVGGYTTGDSGYKEVDWRVWHPWTRDGHHPFASIATPARHSHPVRQYDQPAVSVVIPVGPGHERDVINALDSLEAQTFRQWEAVVVDDTEDYDKLRETLMSFPYVRTTAGHDAFTVASGVGLEARGAGFARNRGVEIARAPLLFFLDADDWLYPQALEKLLWAYGEAGGEVAVYSDYVGLAVLDADLEQKLKAQGRLLDTNAQHHAVVSYQAADFLPGEAVRQPVLERPYLWCNISTLFPTDWHFEVGGFDEEMSSWEDWDYWIRMARLGKRFVRVEEPLLVYRFYSGHRRENGREMAPELAAYMREKYQLAPMVDKMPALIH